MTDTCYLYGDAAERTADDASDGERAVVLQGVRAVRTDELRVVHLGERRAHKLQRLQKGKRSSSEVHLGEPSNY